MSRKPFKPNLYILRWNFSAPGLPFLPVVIQYVRSYSLPPFEKMRKAAAEQTNAKPGRLNLEGVSGPLPADYVPEKDYDIIDLTNIEAPDMPRKEPPADIE